MAKRPRHERAPREGLSLDSATAFLDALAALDPADPAAAERLREAECRTCKATGAAAPAVRAAMCVQEGCGLRDPAHFREERETVLEMRAAARVPKRVPPALVRKWQAYFHDTRCVSLSLATHDDGRLYGVAWYTPTLRAVMHATLIATIAAAAGDALSVNLLHTSGKEMERYVTETNKAHTRSDKRLVSYLTQLGRTPAEIAKEVGVSRSIVEVWQAEEAERDWHGQGAAKKDPFSH